MDLSLHHCGVFAAVNQVKILTITDSKKENLENTPIMVSRQPQKDFPVTSFKLIPAVTSAAT